MGEEVENEGVWGGGSEKEREGGGEGRVSEKERENSKQLSFRQWRYKYLVTRIQMEYKMECW